MQQATLSLVGGDNQNVNLVVTQSDGVTPYNLSGAMLTFNAIKNVSVPGTPLTKTGVLTLPASGFAQLSFVPADTVNMTQTPYVFNVQLLDAGGNLTTLLAGTLNIVSPF